MPNRVTGADEVAADILDSLSHVRAALIDTVNKMAEDARQTVIDEVSAKYNISAGDLQQYITIRRASPGGNGVSASVDLQIKAIPLEFFRPEIRIQPVQIRSKSGRTFNAHLPHVYVTLYKDQPRQFVPGAFPLHQRTSGILQSGDRIRKRTSKARDKLTRMRYFTFPRRVLDPILENLQKQSGDNFDVTVRVAFRRNGVLRSNG